MKLPAVAITSVFADGIALGHIRLLNPLFSTPASLRVVFAGAFLFLLLGVALVRAGKLGFAAGSALCGWLLLGMLAEGIASRPLSADHVLTLVETHKLDLHTPLRWHARLRDEPRRMPWGEGMDVDLMRVEFAGASVPLQGGMRLSYAVKEPGKALAELHAGDEVEFTTQAGLPAIFRDDGAFDRRAYLAQQGIHLVASLRSAGLIERVAPARPSPLLWLVRARAHLRGELDAMLPSPPEVAGVLHAMLLGDRSFVDREESKAFQATGTFHVIVIAGLHVSALAFFLYYCGRVLRLSRATTSLLTLLLLFGYVAVVEVRPPVVRATLMAAVVVLGRMMFRRLELLNSAAIAALVILTVRPLELFDSSFQLSFLAMACIGAIAAPWLERSVEPYAHALRGWRDVTRDAAHDPGPTQFRIDLRSMDRWLTTRLPARLAKGAGTSAVATVGGAFRVWEIFVLSLVLQIGMLPMMAQQFHRIALAGPFANLLAVPITGILVPMGFVTLGAGLIYSRAAALLSVPLAGLARVLIHIVAWWAGFARWSYRIPGPPWWIVMLFFAAFVALAGALRLNARTMMRGALACLVVCAAVIAIYPFAPRFTRGAFEVTALDVGQGDSIFVVSPAGKTLLIDGGGAFGGFRQQDLRGGPDPGEDAVSPYLWSRGFQRLDVVALTHAHQDHIGGLTAVLENFRVASLWIGRETAVPAQVALEELARRRGVTIAHEIRGASFDWDGVRGDVLWPEIAPGEIALSAKNNDSIAVRLAYGKRVILLAGDVEKQAEAQILAQTPDDSLYADVLKVGHHGSKNSTTPEFLERVRPQVALISSGEHNPYGHPSPELLERLERAGVRILRTDESGAIHVLTGGNSLEVRCYAACSGSP